MTDENLPSLLIILILLYVNPLLIYPPKYLHTNYLNNLTNTIVFYSLELVMKIYKPADILIL